MLSNESGVNAPFDGWYRTVGSSSPSKLLSVVAVAPRAASPQAHAAATAAAATHPTPEFPVPHA